MRMSANIHSRMVFIVWTFIVVFFLSSARGYFNSIRSLQRVVGFLLLKSCLMALANTSALPVSLFFLCAKIKLIFLLYPSGSNKKEDRHFCQSSFRLKASPQPNSVVNGDSPSGLRQNHRFFPSSGTERHSVFPPRAFFAPLWGRSHI